MRVFEDRVLRSTFGPTGYRRGGFRNCIILYTSPSKIIMKKSRGMIWEGR
jgi:hypothetical protein